MNGGIDFGGIGTVITALTGVLLTLGTILTRSQRHSQINAGAAMEEAQLRAVQFQAAARHVGYLENMLVDLGGTVPPRPREMSASWWADAIGLDLSDDTRPDDDPPRRRRSRHGR